MTTTVLREAVARLAMTRQLHADSTALLAAARAQFEAEHSALLATVATDATNESEAERTVRALAVDEFKVSGDKTPCEGVSIVLSKVLTYEPATVTDWAKTAMPDLITPPQLNVKAFEKIARTVPLPFVTITETPAVRIASELSV